MNYYIKLENGNTVGHPVAEDNLITAFPSIDLQNLPPEWAKFERIAAPLLKIYEVYEGVEYTLNPDTGVYYDKHIIRPMTEAEKLAEQEKIKTEWANSPFAGYKSWTLDPDTLTFIPPIAAPEPTDAVKIWKWKESEQKWVPLPDEPTPVEGKEYYLDIVDVAWKLK